MRPATGAHHAAAALHALAAATTLVFAGPVGADDTYAVAWLSYSPGAGVPLSFQNANAALGAPARFTGAGIDPGVVTPFHPAFMPGELVSIGPGGWLILMFANPVPDDPDHPYGLDLLLFGNSFYMDLDAPQGVCGPLFEEGGVVDLSADGITWHEVPGIPADGGMPTMGYLDSGPYDLAPGTVPSDFTRPVDPLAAASIELGTDWETLRSIYGSSGGGTGIDMAWTGLGSVRFVRIRVPADAGVIVEIDGLARVAPVAPPAPPADFNLDGRVDGDDLGTLLGAWGTDGDLGNGVSADIDGSGLVDGGDLGDLLGAWS